MILEIDDDRKSALQDKLAIMFRDEFDENLSDFRASQMLDLVLKAVGPTVYNQAVQDVRAYFQTRLDDLDGDVYLDEQS
ncbi:DUF2164 domain-containing protein [Hirschia baltica]|uniref:DUF2164 domain-containing protein n=1 Tax=Hirschia baltica (strain ATCC 49814 / DSM 5838 / IFAM 1418) TaxID=582402 RepID=C6XKF0_HIRBI|nr:DUF2164 domain-containing protein [Hirschia baltica]ACT57748.1 conserved hypothetical protein [Hirschia baltica ATCC 49814]